MVMNSRFRGIFASALAVLLLVALISSCNNLDIFGGKDSSAGRPIATGILAPTNNTKVLVGSPVQILSAPASSSATQVELSVKATNEETGQLISRVNLSSNRTGLQQWTPNRAGLFALTVVAYDANGEEVETLSSQIEVITNAVVSVVSVGAEQGQGRVEATQVPDDTPTPAVIPPGATEVLATAEVVVPTPPLDELAAAFVIDEQVVATSEPITRTFPPPPPAPGVPYGPTQDQLPELIPPVCNAAEFIDVFVGNDPNKRDFITEPDQVLAKVAAGTTVHRAWRLRNIGTCTWGPGYELAFYGGRAMGSGGVAFEAPYPADPPRRNTLVDTNRLIVPEGKPNQTAVLEVLLNTPTFPGIHQSYWRMRNPQGVYFGPIVGVTMEVVRECSSFTEGGRRIYGAPGVNFRIIGVDGNLVGDPGLPGRGPFLATAGQRITLDWNIFNATNFAIVIEGPTGEVRSISSTDPRARETIMLNTVGIHTLTIFAENGSCVNEQIILVDVRPRIGDQFAFQATFATNAPIAASDAQAKLSSEVTPGTIEITWDHFDRDVDEIIFHADLYRRNLNAKTCSVDFVKDWPLLGDLLCKSEEFKLYQRRPSNGDSISNAASATVTLCQQSDLCRSLGLKREIEAEATEENVDTELQPLITQRQHADLIYCTPSESSSIEYGVNYYVEARKNDKLADPQYSNSVFVTCNDISEAGIGPGVPTIADD